MRGRAGPGDGLGWLRIVLAVSAIMLPTTTEVMAAPVGTGAGWGVHSVDRAAVPSTLNAPSGLGEVATFGGAGVPVVRGTERPLTQTPDDEYEPAISGDLVVYARNHENNLDVMYYDLAAGRESQVTTDLTPEELPDVSDRRIVYNDLSARDIWVYEIDTGTRTNITASQGPTSSNPVISHSLVVWEDLRDGNSEIYAQDLAGGAPRRVTANTISDNAAAVSNGVIVWQQCAVGLCEIMTYDWASGTTRQITNTPADDERRPDIWGRRVVYDGYRQGDRDIYAYDLDSGTERRLALPGAQVNPSISGDFVAFEDVATGVYHVRLWHVPSGAVFDTTVGSTEGEFLNDIDGNRVVYTAARGQHLDIYLYTFTVTFPRNDTTAPTLVLPPGGITVNATSPAGAPVMYVVTARDDQDPAPVVTCEPASGSMFAIGSTSVSCAARDASGNQASATFTILVKGVSAQVTDLVGLVKSFNLKQGIENSLDAKLANAQAALGAANAGDRPTACNQLGAFINETQAQSGKALTVDEANQLLAEASRVRHVLGCG